MRSIARRTAVGAALLLVMPVAVWISGWRWQPGEQSWLLKAAFWVTETVTQPWGVITHLILFGWFLWCLRFRIKAAFVLFAILAAAILVGQGVKSWIKDKVQEPRPFVIWLEKTHHIPVDEFYTLKRAERGNLVKEQLAEEKNIPQYLRSHWQKETGFAFSFRSHDVCCQLGTAGRWFAVAASANVNHCYLAGLGNGSHGKPPAARDALATRSGSSYVDFVGAGGGGNVACATNLWAINTTCGRKSRNSATRTRKLTLVDFPNLALKSSTMRVDAISQTARKWYFKGLLR
ncbi:phosphatidylglycerophosphatase B [Escherichia coli MS 85-1]|uniref:Phosphatidylglycerophosphatase B n=5 Tax=root TaxID=1 RepID=A0AAN3M7X4_ECOLX|nr:phosphatidylglycerophosphatase B [Escherichia coli MS 85-1]